MTADIAFQHFANNAAAITAHAPPFVTYRVTTHVSVPSLRRSEDIVRAVSVRTADDTAILQDLPRGQQQIANAFPIIPTLDALSDFSFRYSVSAHARVRISVTRGAPLAYSDPGSNPRADVVAVSLRYYKAAYAPDSSDGAAGTSHIVLTPYDFFVKAQPRGQNPFFLSDLWVDNRTQLPSRIRFTGADDVVFEVDYGVIGTNWLITHLHYEATMFAPLRIARLHFATDSTYEQFTFPVTAPDARLALPAGPAGPAGPAASPGTAPAPAVSPA